MFKENKFIRKADLMKTDSEYLMIIDDSIYKTYIGNWDMTRTRRIIYNSYTPLQLSADKLHGISYNEYIGIKRDIIRDNVKRCEACYIVECLRENPIWHILIHIIFMKDYLWILLCAAHRVITIPSSKLRRLLKNSSFKNQKFTL